MILVALVKRVWLFLNCHLNRLFKAISFRCGLLVLGVFSGSALADDVVEFDQSLIRQMRGQQPIDASRFSRGNSVLAGRYRLEIWVNGMWRGKLDLRFQNKATKQDAQLCANKALINKIDLKNQWEDKALKALRQSDCLSLPAHLPQTKVRLNLSDLTLNISIAQSLVNSRPRGYIDPASWEESANSVFTTYRANHYRHKNSNDENHNTYINFNSGANIGDWQLRHAFTLSQAAKGDWNYQGLNTYVQRNLPDWRSQLTAGYFYTSNDWQDNISIRGIQIASEERMLPDSQQGFAPTIRDTAQSNALVQVFQQAHEIYNTTVPAGEFEIKDLYPLHQGGELTLVITEADGSKRQRIINYQASAGSIRAGSSRWQFAAGQLRKSAYEVYPDYLVQGAWSHGLNNRLSVNAGLTYAKDYQSATLGGNLSLPIGTLSATAKHAKADVDDTRYSGNRYRLNFYRQFSATNTGLSLSGDWSSSPYYPQLTTVLAENHNANEGQLRPANRKSGLSLNINQNLPDGWGNLYVNSSREQFWNSTSERQQWQLGYSNHFGKLEYQLTASQSQLIGGGDERDERRYLLSFSLPLGSEGNHRLQSRINHASDNTLYHVGVSGHIEALDDMSYGWSGSRNQATGQTAWSANVGYTSRYAQWEGSYGQSGDNRQWSLGLSGAVVGHAGGVTLANALGETFAIVRAKGATGAQLEGASEQSIDSRGYGIVPSLSPYRKNVVGIDPEGLPLDLQIDATTTEVIPQAGSSVFVELNSHLEVSRLFAITLANGDKAPFAAELWDKKGNNLGFVAQNGRAFARGLQPEGDIQVVWGEKTDQRCRFHYQLQAQDTADNAKSNTALNHLKLNPVKCL